MPDSASQFYADPYKPASTRFRESASAGLLTPFADTVQHVSIDHRRHLFVTRQFLNRTDVIAILQQIGAMESHRLANAIA